MLPLYSYYCDTTCTLFTHQGANHLIGAATFMQPKKNNVHATQHVSQMPTENQWGKENETLNIRTTKQRKIYAKYSRLQSIQNATMRTGAGCHLRYPIPLIVLQHVQKIIKLAVLQRHIRRNASQHRSQSPFPIPFQSNCRPKIKKKKVLNYCTHIVGEGRHAK